MPVTLSIKNVPDDLARRLRKRAEIHHRSLQGELMAIIEAAASGTPVRSLRELGEYAVQLGLGSPSGEAARLVREDRDDPDR
jgi:antitoxin FitA